MNRRTWFFLLGATAALCLLALPDAALAWGPGAHVAMSNWLLANPGLIPPEFAGPIIQYPGQFIHGALSPDIFIGKGSKAVEGHSHNWDSGLLLLGKSNAPRWQAYACGYLSHLAADTVAHNVFVPEAFTASLGKGRLAHVYLEAQADRLLDWRGGQAVRAFREDGSRRAAMVLRSSLPRNAAFALRKNMLQGSILLADTLFWRRALKLLHTWLAPEAIESFLDAMLHYSLRAVLSVLRDPHESPVLRLDPIGAEALDAAMRSGKTLLPRPRAGFSTWRDTPEGLLAPDTSLLTVKLPEILHTLPAEGVPPGLIRPDQS